MGVVLSGTARVVLSGTDESSYQEPESVLKHGNYYRNPPLNLANIESFRFFLTLDARHRSVDIVRAGARR